MAAFCSSSHSLKEKKMKGNPNIIHSLNGLLADELTAIDQYMVHAGMADNWGYGKLHEYFEKRAIDEMKHAEMLIDRILFLEGIPVVSKLNQINIGAEVPGQLSNDHAAEETAIKGYNVAIKQCYDLGDGATRELLEHILQDEDRHIDGIEEKQDQISQMTLPTFLSEQIS
jgi:bacterioferritin